MWNWIAAIVVCAVLGEFRSSAAELHFDLTTRGDCRIKLFNAEPVEYAIETSLDMKTWKPWLLPVPFRGEFTAVANGPTNRAQFFRARKTQNPPLVVTQPKGTNVTAASVKVSMSVAVAGSKPIQVQWMRNGAPIPGATNTAYAFTGAPTDSGVFTVFVSNPYGFVLSSQAAVMIAAPAAPPPTGPVAPATIAGRIVDVYVSDGIPPFASSGHYKMAFDADGRFLLVWPNGEHGQTSGDYSYFRSADRSKATLNIYSAAFGPAVKVSLAFNSVSAGSFTLHQTSTTGYQAGTFTIQ